MRVKKQVGSPTCVAMVGPSGSTFRRMVSASQSHVPLAEVEVVARDLALVPEVLLAAAVEPDLGALDGALEGAGVHGV